MIRLYKSSSILFAAFLTLSITCGPVLLHAADAKPTEKVNFQDHILPILRSKCGTCHSAGQAKGGLVIETHTSIMQGGASGAVIEAGNLDGSRLWDLVNHKEQPYMPPNEGKLPDETLALIQKWIVGGALENKDSKPKIKKTAQFTLSPTDISSGKPTGPPPMPENLPTEPLTVSSRGNSVTALAVNPWSPLAAVSGHRQVLLYDLTDFTLAGVLPFPEGTVHVLRFSRNGSLLLAAGGRGGQSGRVVVFDVRTGKRAFTVGTEFDSILAADISPNHGQIALGGPKKMVRVYSTADGELQYEMKKHTDWITALEFSPDGVLLASGDRSNGLVVWEANTGREFYVLNGHSGGITSVSWRLDSNLLASSSEDSTVRLWEMNNGSQVKSWGAHGGGTASVQFLRNGRLVSTGRDRVARLWEGNGSQVLTFPGLPDLGMRVSYDETAGAALAGDWTGRVYAWDAKSGQSRGVLATNPPLLAERIGDAVKNLTAAEAGAARAASRLSDVEKMLAERKANASRLKKQAEESRNALQIATAAKSKAERNRADKTTALQKAQMQVQVTRSAFQKAKAEREAAEKDKDKKDLPARTAALQTAETAFAAAQKTHDAATSERAASEKDLTSITNRLPQLAQQAASLKSAAEKAEVDSRPNRDQLKTLEDARTAAQTAAAVAAARKVALAKLKDQQARAAQSASLPAKN